MHDRAKVLASAARSRISKARSKYPSPVSVSAKWRVVRSKRRVPSDRSRTPILLGDGSRGRAHVSRHCRHIPGLGDTHKNLEVSKHADMSQASPSTSTLAPWYETVHQVFPPNGGRGRCLEKCYLVPRAAVVTPVATSTPSPTQSALMNDWGQECRALALPGLILRRPSGDSRRCL